MTQKNFKFMFTLYFIVFGIVITLFGSLVGYRIHSEDIGKNIEKSANEIAYYSRTVILKPHLEKMDTLLNALATNKVLKKYVTTPTQSITDEIKNLFYVIALSDTHIMQARFINVDGIEKIRVDRANESSLPIIIEDQYLQNKANRDYFQKVKKLQNGEIWHSKLDLNIENGKIEVPFRPTIRVATPLYLDNKFQGIVIINLLTNELINEISSSTAFEHYIIDKDGYFILHPDKNKSWSKYVNNNIRLHDDFPSDATNILAGKLKGEDFFAFPLDVVLNNEDDAILILKPKSDYLDSLINANIQSFVIVVILSIMLSIPLAMYASSAPSKLQKALIISNTELKRFADIIDKFVITATTKTSSVITSVSTAFSKVSGYSKKELIGQKINVLRDPNTPKELYQKLWETIESGEEWNHEIKNRKKDGTEFWLDQNIIPVKDEDGNVTSYMSVGIEISAKKELEHIANVDKLTGLYNRRKIDECSIVEVEKAKRHKTELALMMFDIDHFKNINDTYGHQTGDYVLKSLGNILLGSTRMSDIIGRYGGEEFVMICPHTSKEAALLVAEKIRKIVEEYEFDIIGKLTISIGVSILEANETMNELMFRADSGLYEAKKNGRNRVVFF